eukprot:CAMPEP_0179917044 /NCGR_PEP_ID=MMETSP0983-20121128/2596_1 /TAXON_ID=483367 /ORGANISM="non described non described, Strain CCMP 2436" /LENGTH=82 /DNA_ID=CAMNT_0021819699 /DNA_START=433 /DNA_END=676 /DNA_ORIENTATION=-
MASRTLRSDPLMNMNPMQKATPYFLIASPGDSPGLLTMPALVASSLGSGVPDPDRVDIADQHVPSHPDKGDHVGYPLGVDAA